MEYSIPLEDYETYIFNKHFPLKKRNKGCRTRNTIPENTSCGRLFITNNHRKYKNKISSSEIHVNILPIPVWRTNAYFNKWKSKEIKVYCNTGSDGPDTLYGTLYTGILRNKKNGYFIIEIVSIDYQYVYQPP